MSVVVDTSDWIDWFKGRQVDAVDQALDHGLVVLPPLVIAELVAGARRRGEREQLEAALTDLPICECPRAHWVRVGALLTRNAVFTQLAALCPLQL